MLYIAVVDERQPAAEKENIMHTDTVSIEQFQATTILRFAAISAKATEAEPLKLGNAEFWIGTESWSGALIHDPPSNQWDKEAVQEDLNAYLSDKLEDLKKYIEEQHWPAQLEVTK